MLTGIRIFLLLISLYGYLCFLSQRLHCNLAIGVLFACIGSLMFLAGMMNMLSIFVWLIVFTGLFLAVNAFLNRIYIFRPDISVCAGPFLLSSPVRKSVPAL